MTALLRRAQLQNGVALSMALGTEYNAFIGPLHGFCPYSANRSNHNNPRITPSETLAPWPGRARVLRRCPPPPPLADGLDGRPTLTEHDLALAFALHIDRLLDADVAVAQFLP